MKNRIRIIAIYIALACVSLVVTGDVSTLSGPAYLLLPVSVILRLVTLAFFTLPAFLTAYKRTLMLGLSSLWLLFLGFSHGRFIEASVTAFVVLGCTLIVFLMSERKNPQKDESIRPAVRKATGLLYFSFLFIMLLEFLQTCSFIAPIRSMLGNPDVLALNLLYFTAIGSFVLWIRKPILGGAIYLLFWLIFGFASMAKNINNFEPALIPDLFIFGEGFSAMCDILGIAGVIGVLAAVALAVFGLVMLGIKTKKREKAPRRTVMLSVGFFFIGVVTCVLSTLLPWIDFDAVSSRELFSRNGYVYSFITTGYRTFKTKPDNYKAKEIAPVLIAVDEAGKNSKDKGIDEMNIIVVQMESFMDPTVIDGIELERDPIPFIHSLEKKYSHGTVTVPIFGGQTVKSEFEFLTGTSMDNLPYGYNPFALYLNNNSVDSFARYLSGLGFRTVGMHDYQGEFFGRDDVYGNLGFDCFTSYELMPGVKKKEGSIWADDGILVDQIRYAIDNSGNDRNFVFAVTVQTHGAYPSLEKEDYPFEIGGIADAKTEGKLAYYISQLEQLDRHVAELCELSDQSGRPTMIILYSDHLPTFALDLNGIEPENRFNVSFYTWDNLGLPYAEPEPMELYMLSNYICDSLGMDGSFMNRFHRLYGGSDDYASLFEKVQYYKLFEEPSESVMENSGYTIGLMELSIGSIEKDDATGDYIIHGTGMTENTHLCVDGKVYDLKYVDERTMRFVSPKRQLSPPDAVSLRIIGEKYGSVMKESETYEWG